MHFIYYINKLTAMKVDSSYLLEHTTYMFCGELILITSSTVAQCSEQLCHQSRYVPARYLQYAVSKLIWDVKLKEYQDILVLFFVNAVKLSN